MTGLSRGADVVMSPLRPGGRSLKSSFEAGSQAVSGGTAGGGRSCRAGCGRFEGQSPGLGQAA